jgi:hypothetical protein
MTADPRADVEIKYERVIGIHARKILLHTRSKQFDDKYRSGN